MNQCSNNKACDSRGMKPRSHKRNHKTVAGVAPSAGEPCFALPNHVSFALPNPVPNVLPASRPAPRAWRRGRSDVGGFSLIELMIAMAIGVILMIALTNLLVDVKSTFVREDQFARLQESARVSVLLASRHLRSTRSLGCRSVAMVQHEGNFNVQACKLINTPLNTACDHTGWQSDGHFLTTDRALGYDNSDLSSATATTLSDDLPRSAADKIAARWLRGDILVTWGVDGEGAAVTGTLADVVAGGGFAGTGQFSIATPPDGLSDGRLALITDCAGADLFEISGPKDLKSGSDFVIDHSLTNDKAEKVNASDAFGRDYNRFDATVGRQLAQTVHRANVYPFSYNAYYICCVDTNGSKGPELLNGNAVAKCNTGDLDRYRPSLCVWSLEAQESQALVTDVADMRVTYTGGDADGDGKPDFFADDTSTVHTAAWVSDENNGQGVWANVRSAAVELLVTTGQDGVITTAKLPANAAWPPGNNAVVADTLGYGMPADTRLYERFVINVATRSRTPWYIAP